MSPALSLHPDRALPPDPTVRAIAREILTHTRDLPLICMHGHVEAEVLARDEAFGDPAALLVTPDHYVTRMLVSQGGDLAGAGVPHAAGPAGGPAPEVETDPRAVWRRLCEAWPAFRGTPSRFWLEHELVEVFGVDLVPGPATADAIYDRIAAAVAAPEFRPRALLDRFRIEVIATTDAADDPLEHHAALARDGYGERVLPTFRPDAVVYADRPDWAAAVRRLGDRADVDTTHYDGYLEALRRRRQAFVQAGARASDHGHRDARTEPLPPAVAADLYSRALKGPVGRTEADAFAAHMLHTFAGMACDDGLVMQIHPGSERDHHRLMHLAVGADRGFDIPVAVEFTRSLQPLLQTYGMSRDFRVILFTLDETTYSRELAPLAGVYPSVRLGAPWWFLDAPHAMRRYREAVTETAGFYNTSGFVDDTRAFASIPARHDLSRRIDAGYLAQLVAEHRLTADEAVETAVDLAVTLPRLAYARRTPA